MAYQKETWANDAAGGTPITAGKLNHLETQYDESVATAAADATTKANQAVVRAAQDASGKYVPLGTGAVLPAYASTTPYISPDGSYEYEVTIVKSPGGGLNTILEKVYAKNYEKGWTPGTTFYPPTIPFADFQQDSGAYVILSSDAFQGGQMAGLQIKKGVLYRDWGNYSNDPRVGQEAIALMKNGSWAVFRKTTHTASQVVAAGADTTWGFGPLVVVDGAVRSDLGDSSKWKDWVTELSARHLLGYNSAGDLVSIIVKGKTGSSGIAGTEMGKLALKHGCVNAIMLDGGGSTQGRSSYSFHPSTDSGGNRNVNNVLAVKAPLVSPITLDWTPVDYQNGFTAAVSSPLSVTKVNGEVYFRGTAQLGSVAANTWYTVGTLPPAFRTQTSGSYRDSVYTNNGGYPGVVSIGSDGVIQVKSPVAVSSGTFWQLDGKHYTAAY